MDSDQVDHWRKESGPSINGAGALNASPQSSTCANPLSPKDGTMPPAIPTHHPYRTLVVCFDGTGDQFNSDNSNVVELFSLLKKDDPSKQLVYYQAGIGTYSVPQIPTPFLASLSQMVDQGLAWDLDAHVMGGYDFLMQNYAANDRICIFGFSRGAYTARCLAGMIHKVGLLPRSNYQQVPFAYRMYTHHHNDQAKVFKRVFSIDVDIEFLGVWDSVNSVGFIPRALPFSTANSIVRTFRHAISLDERRVKFEENTWGWPHKAAHTNGKSGVKSHNDNSRKHRWHTDVDEVWFAGCHSDVGGGSVDNGTKPCLARTPLRWMIRECFKTKCGIIFLTEDMKRIGLDPASLYPVVLPRPPPIPVSSLNPKPCIADVPKTAKPTTSTMTSTAPGATTSGGELTQTEDEAELHDSLAPLYDGLVHNGILYLGIYWFLELFPMQYRFHNHDNKWHFTWGWHFAAGRRVPDQSLKGVKVHRSVKTRLEAAYENGSKYSPKANVDLTKVTWVD